MDLAISWSERPREVRNLLNPSFCGMLLRECVTEHVVQKPMPMSLAFLVLPLVLHGPTRDALPIAVSTSITSWVGENVTIIYDFDKRVRSLNVITREAIMWSLATRELTLIDGALEKLTPNSSRRLPDDPFNDYKSCVRRARFLGRWFRSASDAATIFALFGVRP
jgi:hypothetical protein